MCKKHTRDAEIRPFFTGFYLKSVSFLSFSERCKNQGSFCKCLIINKVLFLYRTCAWGKIKKTLTIFSTLAKNSVKFFSQNRFTRAFSLLFATAPTTTATAATRPCKRKKKAAGFLLPPQKEKLSLYIKHLFLILPHRR